MKAPYPDFDPGELKQHAYIPLALITDDRVSDGAKLLYGILRYCFGSSKGGREQICNPGITTLASVMKTSERNIGRWLAELRDFEYIRTERHGPDTPAVHFFLRNPRLEAQFIFQKKRTKDRTNSSDQNRTNPSDHGEARSDKFGSVIGQILSPDRTNSVFAYKEEEQSKEQSEGRDVAHTQHHRNDAVRSAFSPYSELTGKSLTNADRAVIASFVRKHPDVDAGAVKAGIARTLLRLLDRQQDGSDKTVKYFLPEIESMLSLNSELRNVAGEQYAAKLEAYRKEKLTCPGMKARVPA